MSGLKGEWRGEIFLVGGIEGIVSGHPHCVEVFKSGPVLLAHKQILGSGQRSGCPTRDTEGRHAVATQAQCEEFGVTPTSTSDHTPGKDTEEPRIQFTPLILVHHHHWQPRN